MIVNLTGKDLSPSQLKSYINSYSNRGDVELVTPDGNVIAVSVRDDMSVNLFVKPINKIFENMSYQNAADMINSILAKERINAKRADRLASFAEIDARAARELAEEQELAELEKIYQPESTAEQFGSW